MQRGFLAGAVSLMMVAAPGTALADDAACMARFKELVAGGNPKSGPVRIHAFQDVAGNKSENYFYSPGDQSGDGLTEPIKNAGDMWVLFRKQRMFTSTDKGKTWKFGRQMDAAADPAAVMDGLRKDAETAANVNCAAEDVNGVMHDTVAGEYNSSTLQGALYKVKYWIRQDNGFMSKHEAYSKVSGMDFTTMQIIEPWPDLTLPDPE